MTDREYFRWVFVVGVLIAALIAGALEADAHTLDEIEAWETDWALRLAQLAEHAAAVGGLSVRGLEELIAERHDFEGRHRWHYNPELEPRETSRRSGPSVPYNVENWRPLVSRYFAAGDVDRALCLIWHESRGDPSAKNPRSSATGLFQILAFWEDRYGLDRWDPARNVQLAAIIRDVQGWTAWSPYNRGLCR